VQTGNTDKFDAKLVQEIIASGISAYLSSYRATMLIMAALIALTAALCFWILPRHASKASVASPS
jgi:uncharacterized membrane protein YccC